MSIKYVVNYPENMDALRDKASEVVSKILIKKLQPKEREKLVELLKDESINI